MKANRKSEECDEVQGIVPVRCVMPLECGLDGSLSSSV